MTVFFILFIYIGYYTYEKGGDSFELLPKPSNLFVFQFFNTHRTYLFSTMFIVHIFDAPLAAVTLY